MRGLARKAVVTGAVMGLVGGGYLAWRRYGGVDPYTAFTKGGHTADPTQEIKAKGVKIRQYVDGKLVGETDAKSLTVGQDRNRLTLRGIKNGKTKGPNGPMQFAAKKGILNPNLRTADLSGGVRVKGTDFDVTSSVATLNGKLGVIDVPTPLKGTIKDMQFSAASLTHRMNTDYTKIVRPLVVGKLPKGLGMPGMQASKVWAFTGDDVTNEKGQQRAENGWASDGDLVITAPHLARDPKTDVVTATSEGGTRVTYRSAKADVVADKVVIDQKAKVAFCTGHVLVYVRPKGEWDKPLDTKTVTLGPLVPDIPASLTPTLGKDGTLSDDEKAKIEALRSTKNLRDYPMQLSAEEVTYWYKEGERHMIAKKGRPTAFQRFEDGRWRQAWAPEARYDGEKDMLNLVGGTSKREVHLENSVADVNDCFLAKMSTKEDQTEDTEYLWMKSPKGKGIDFDADKPKKETPAKPPAGKTPPPSGG